jgi:hypothetical protein
MKRKLLGGVLMIAALSAILGVLNFTHTTVVQADCTAKVNGKSVTTESGTLVCDCTATGSSCSCIVPVLCQPPGPGGEEGGS